jgi:hypothetical protein
MGDENESVDEATWREILAQIDHEHEMTRQPTSIVAVLCSFHVVVIIVIVIIVLVASIKGCI